MDLPNGYLWITFFLSFGRLGDFGLETSSAFDIIWMITNSNSQIESSSWSAWPLNRFTMNNLVEFGTVGFMLAMHAITL